MSKEIFEIVTFMQLKHNRLLLILMSLFTCEFTIKVIYLLMDITTLIH